jgi:putative PIN family toxin of toxin-antitoxin system
MKVVLDTNVVISALLHQGPTRRFLELWRTRKIKPQVSQAILDEYVRVLHYPKFGFGAETAAEILEENLLPWLSKVEEYAGKLEYSSKDKSDDLFLRAAFGGKVEALVSGDPHLTTLNGKYPFAILTPGAFLSKFFVREK